MIKKSSLAWRFDKIEFKSPNETIKQEISNDKLITVK